MDGENPDKKVSSILEEYNNTFTLYSDFAKSMEKLIDQLLNQRNFKVHSVTSRAKDKVSLRSKISRASGTYSQLRDVTDLCGVRIITYLADDIDAISGLIEKQFDVDQSNSVDKRALLDPDRFGYVSLHYVVRLKPSRTGLPEYQRFAHLKFEIQIRSILQHAWAEIEHDLGYKTKQAVPAEIRRRFSRLAGLLEVADTEFDRVRDDLEQYRGGVSQKIRQDPASVTIDKDSLFAYIMRNKRVHRLDKRIAAVAQARIVYGKAVIGQDVDEVYFAGLRTIADIDRSLDQFGETATRFASLWIKERYDELHAGICLFYLCYVLVARRGKARIEDYVKRFNIGDPDELTTLSENVLSTYNSVTADNIPSRRGR